MCALERLGCDSVGKKFEDVRLEVGQHAHRHKQILSKQLSAIISDNSYLNIQIIHFNQRKRTRRMPASQKVK